MKNFFRISMLVAFSVVCAAFSFGQTKSTATDQTPVTQAPTAADTRIPLNSKVYIAPMNGFESYLAAAMRKKEVPVVLVADRDLADFEITGVSEKKGASKVKMIFMGDMRGAASASMQVVNLKTKIVAFADSSSRGSANRGERSTAEKLAKYLKKKMEEDAKKK